MAVETGWSWIDRVAGVGALIKSSVVYRSEAPNRVSISSQLRV